MEVWIAAGSAYVTAGFGLAGSLIGGAMAAFVSQAAARQALEAAEKSWVRDNRREMYERFLNNAQRLLIACQAAFHADDDEEAADTVLQAYLDFFSVYSVVQTVAERAVVEAARVHAYRLLELRKAMQSQGLGRKNFNKVAGCIRDARHQTIDAMRADLGFLDSAQPAQPYNPFAGTSLADAYATKYLPHGGTDEVPPASVEP